MPPILRSVSSLRGSAAHTQYSLWIQGLEGEALSVLGFTAEDYALSAEYRFEIEFEAREVLDPAKLIGSRARLELDAVHPGTAPVHGVVTRIEALEGASDGVRQRLSLCAPLTVLDQAAATRAFPDLTVPEIIEEVLKEHGLGADAWRLALEQDYPALALTVQCAETDLVFLKRLMARHGLYYRYEQDEDQAVLVIHDSVQDLPEAPVGSLPYIPLKGEHRTHEAVHRVESVASLLTESVRLGDYNPETPDLALTGEAANDTDIPGTGQRRAWGEHLRDSEGAGTCARLAAERLAWQRAQVRAYTDHRRLAPGMRLSLEGHPDARVNITYTVVALRISAEQRAALPMGGEAERPTFEAELTLIPAALCYRPEPIAPPRLGRVTARIESPGGDYAHLDAHGRYRLRLDFDERDNQTAEASSPVRLAAPFAGDGYGFHFPLLAGTEVLVTFENDDPDRPVIEGALYNHAQPSPVNAANASQNILRTPGGNELLMDDQRGAERIALTTRDEQLSLTLDATEGTHQLSLRTEQGDMDWHAGEGLTLECGADQTVQVGGEQHVTVEQAQRLVTKHAGIDYQAGTDIRLSAKQTVRLESESADIAQRSEQDTAIEAGRHMRLNARGGDLECLVEQGATSIRARGEQQLVSTHAHARLGTAGGAVSITQAGDIAFKGRRITLEAQNIDIKAGNIGLDMGGGVQMAGISAPAGGFTSSGTSAAAARRRRSPASAAASDDTAPVSLAPGAAEGAPAADEDKAERFAEPAFHIVRETMSRTALLEHLYGDPHARPARFDPLNPGLGERVRAGEMIVLGDPDARECSREEADLMGLAAQVNAEVGQLDDETAQLAIDYFDLFDVMTSGTTTGLGAGAVMISRQFAAIEDTLRQIERLHQDTYRRHGRLNVPEFYAQRRALFNQLDFALGRVARKGLSLKDEQRIKRALGLSSKSIVHHWKRSGVDGIPGYGTHYERVHAAAKYARTGGYIAIGLDAGLSGMRIREACTSGNEQQCEQVKYREGGRFTGSVGGGVAGGFAGYALCAAVGLKTVGVGGIACGIILSGAGAAAGGYGGGQVGEGTGEYIWGKVSP